MDSKELKKLAKDIHDGLVFTDRHIAKTDKNLIGVVFNKLTLLKKEDVDNLKKDCGLLYEYYKVAGPSALSGYPIFTSFKWLTKEDAEKVITIARGFIEDKTKNGAK